MGLEPVLELDLAVLDDVVGEAHAAHLAALEHLVDGLPVGGVREDVARDLEPGVVLCGVDVAEVVVRVGHLVGEEQRDTASLVLICLEGVREGALGDHVPVAVGSAAECRGVPLERVLVSALAGVLDADAEVLEHVHPLPS